MNSIKVGDFVKILDGSSAVDYSGGWVGAMNAYVGKVYRVSKVDEKSCHVEGERWTFDIDYVKRVSPSINPSINNHGIKRVIINDPATIILWEDGSKTVVKCGANDLFDPEKGIAMAIVKHVMFDGHTTQMNKWFDKMLKPYYEEEERLAEIHKNLGKHSVRVDDNVG